MKKVSMIVLVYNVEKYLEKCLDSLVNQTYKDKEIIIVNDGSTDNSIDILNSYQKKYPEMIKIYSIPNGGRSNARNYGISKVSSEFFTFVDGDDYLDKDYLKIMMDKMSDNTDIVVCDAIRIINGEEATVLKFFKEDIKEKNKAMMLSHPGPCGKIYRTKLFKENNITFMRDIRLYEDLAVIPTLGLYTDKIVYVNKPLYKYVIHSSSALRQVTFNKNINDVFIVVEELSKKFDGKYRDELEFIYTEHLLRTASLRYTKYREGKKYIAKISDIMHAKYPDYNKNKYFKKVKFGFKLLCFLAYHKMYLFLKLVGKLAG